MNRLSKVSVEETHHGIRLQAVLDTAVDGIILIEADGAGAHLQRRGINSIQLFRDPDHGWRIVAMI
jgi:hypothetical protein